MAKDNYKNEFEQSRQEIDITEGADGEKVYSRVDLHATANTANRSRFSLINILLVIFTLIPISILAFVLFSLLFNNEPITPKVEDNAIQFEKKPGGSSAVVDDEKDKEKDKDKEKEQKEEKSKKEKQKQEEQKKKEAEKKKKAEEKKAEEKKKEEEKKKAEEEKKAEEQRKAEEQKRKEEEKRAEEERKKAEEEKKQQAGSHVVQPGETLYRISVIHYGNGDGVEKIRSANGISENSISVGQTLVIPK